MRFVVNVNLSPDGADLLAGQGHDAVHWRDVGAIDALDDDIIAWAVPKSQIVFMADLDFAAAVATRDLKAPSIVQLRLESTDPLTVDDFVFRSIAAGKALDGGAILTIDSGQARLRPSFGTIP